MHWSRTLVAAVLLLLLIAACGGPAATADGDGDGNGSGDRTEQSEGAEPTPAPDDDGDGNGGGGGVGSGDLEGLMDGLTPPNSSEVSRTSGDGFLFVTFESSDTTDSLSGFYEDAIADTGMGTVSRTESEGSFSWIFAEDDNSAFGGVVSLIPATDGGPGSTVSIQIGSGE